MSRFASFAASGLIGAGLAAIAFAGGSGFELSSVTWLEIGAVVAGGALVTVAILRARAGRLDGGLTLLLFAGLASLCALSIAWSVAPERSWESANLTVAYLALFAGALALARLRPDAVATVLRGILLAASAVIVYALITRVWPSLWLQAEWLARHLETHLRGNHLLENAAALAFCGACFGGPGEAWLAQRRLEHPKTNPYPFLPRRYEIRGSREARTRMAPLFAVTGVALLPL